MSLLSTQGNGSSGNSPNPVQGELQPGLSRPQQDSFSKETSSLTQDTEDKSSVVNNGNQSGIPNQQAYSQREGFVITDQQLGENKRKLFKSVFYHLRPIFS